MNAMKWITLAIFSLVIAGCGEGLQPKIDSCAQGNNCTSTGPGGGNNGGNNGGGDNNSSKIPDDLVIDGEINGGAFDKTSVIELDKDNKMLILRLPMPANPVLLDVYAEIPIPQIEGAKVTFDSLNNGGFVMSVHLPLDVALKGIDFIEPAKLPNGDPLPMIPGGELPVLALQVHEEDEVQGYLYLGANIVGIYVTTPFNPFIRLTYPIRNKDRSKTLGYFTVLPEKGDFQGGFFTSLSMPDEVARVLEEIL